MTLEIHKPELVQRVQAQIQSGNFNDTDEFIEKALNALEKTTTVPTPELALLRRKNFVELCDPVRGLAEDVDFGRNPSTTRPLDL
jgi:Arc/MetJ-type ribon-helix-helix transcriptional regulator